MEIYQPDLIISNDNKPHVRAYLIERGYHAADINLTPVMTLINTYHMVGWTNKTIPNDDQVAAASALIEKLKADLPQPSPKPRPNGMTHYRTELVIRIAMLAHPIMLVGPAGCGKTTIGEHVAQALNLTFYITGTISDTHELVGFVDGYGKYHDTPFRNAFEKGGVWIADEIDAWEANALLAANSALANGFCNFPDQPVPIKRHPDFRMIATANTFGTGADRIYVGRNELDGASLDRFATIDVDYDLDLERMFSGNQHKWLEYVWAIRKLVERMRIRHVVSSRAVSMGAAALSIGIDWGTVKEIYLFKGMSAKDKEKVTM